MAWRTPSPPEVRAAAMEEYVAGESLCDAKQVEGGLLRLRAAYRLAWELDAEPWPQWADDMHTRLLAGLTAAPDDAPIPLLDSNTSLLQPSMARLRCPQHREDGSWWSSAAAMRTIHATLRQRSFVVLDGFAGAADAAALRAAGRAACVTGLLQPACSRSREHARSEHIAWDPPGFSKLSSRTDTLLRALRTLETAAGTDSEPAGEGGGAVEGSALGLRSVFGRQRLMFSRYGCSDFFSRHVDNNCTAAGGPLCNPRVLTAVYYMQTEWPNTHGGCLRLFRPMVPVAGSAEEEVEEDGVARAAVDAEVGSQNRSVGTGVAGEEGGGCRGGAATSTATDAPTPGSPLLDEEGGGCKEAAVGSPTAALGDGDALLDVSPVRELLYSTSAREAPSSWPLQDIVLCRGFCTRINTIILKHPLCVGTPLTVPHRLHYCAMYYIPPTPLIAIYTM